MAFLEPLPGKVYLKETNVACGDVSGIIGITGDAIGSLAISFNEACICQIINSMLGESYKEANQDVFDGVGEITNMISGVARTYMEKEGMVVYAAIPSVIYGKDHMINHILNSPSIVIPFVIDGGSFFVDVCIKRTEEEIKKPGDYRVVNQKTPVDRRQPESRDMEPAPDLDRKAVLKNKLQEIIAVRDDMVKQLSEKPFMDISKRQLLKKRVPFLDVKIKRLRLDIATIDMLGNISKEDMENPKIVEHYQHYENDKRKC
ncbi:MAG: chemotaxis protein CheX [Deltaproteobacteria bacterium]|nr:chemotaxis protein CheX [Deltaproteobacteria bacterium]